MAFQYGNDLAGVKKFIEAENNYLQSLHLMVQTKNASGSIFLPNPLIAITTVTTLWFSGQERSIFWEITQV